MQVFSGKSGYLGGGKSGYTVAYSIYFEFDMAKNALFQN
jgi:hypothetical protein